MQSAHAADLGESSVGDPSAPVTIIEYSSMTCPHCAAFHADTLPELKARYIDTGKVRLVLRDFPLDQNALRAAVLAHCAGPERHPQFTEVFFAQQSNWARSDDPIKALKQLAQLGGLSQAAADACLADKDLETAILKEQLEGQEQYDIRSTPSFIIDGRTLAGGQTIEDFAEIIDPLLPQ
jgi:protein-disulfide isomerase